MKSLLTSILAAIISAASLSAQILTGTISGTVVDTSDNIIVGAKVTLASERTGDSRTAATNDSGGFSFPAVQPGSYTVKVEHPGFRPFQKTGNILTANERLSVGTLQLQLGSLAETVTVTAVGAQVQTTSSERSALLAPKQLEMIAIRGRDVVSMLRILPGVSQQVDTENLGGSFGTTTPNIQGARANWNSLAVDGLTGNDLGSPSVFSSPINLDAIGEVKVLLNNYQAEVGRNGGSFVNIVTKSGTREYHGSAYWFKRHEQYNANNFFNNRTGVPKPRYRYATIGATFGGPLYIPKLVPRGQEKLFFFYSYEQAWTQNPQALRQVTTPTDLERRGDFSQSLDQNGRLIPITDPDTRAPFPNNQVPLSRVNRNGQAILNIFPLPNLLDRNITRGNYNFQFQESLQAPRWQHLFRTDWKPTNQDSFAFRGSLWYADQLGYAVAAGGANWGLTRQHYTYTDNGVVMNYARILSPTLVNEFMGGVRHGVEKGPPESDTELARVQRNARGLATLGQYYPANNPLGIIPQANFGGVPSAAAVSYDGRYPLRGADTIFNFSDSVTWNKGSHTLKAGFAFERVRNYEGEQGNYGGTFNFNRDVNNPFDTNYAYSNALLGLFQSYSESDTRPSNEGRKTVLGWYIQDTWKINRKLTLDYGFRFTWYSQWVQDSGKAAAFVLDRYNPARTPQLYRPVNAQGGRRSQNPITGEILPAVYIGAIVPNSGDPFNVAILATDQSYPAGFREQEPVLPEPRFGFAYDVFGNGKTAIRSSFGLFHNTVSPGVRAFAQNPPNQITPNVFYGNLATYLTTSGVLFPNNNTGFTRRMITPSLYNYTFGIQQDVGFATIVDAAFVGSVGRHLQHSRNINTVPYGARFLPQNADPTNPSTPLSDNFFRPYPGWGNLTLNENVSTSNYNALQLAANRRFVRGLQFGVAYTWSKAMNYVNSDGDGVAQYRPLRIWNYGKAGYDQTHIFIVNYTWDLPKGSRLWNTRPGRVLLDGWLLSGITSFYSGFPSGAGFSTVDGADISGGGDGARINVTGKAQLASGDRSFSRFFDPAVFRRPGRGDAGNSPKDVFRGPGANNWDLSLFKNFPIGSESRYLQLRVETYNTFNHSQWSGVDSTARFDAQGNQVNARFGEVTSASTARLMQLSLRFNF
ncbi:MAG: TonB-dependent receptor [Acidobacteria bacterium]|nr:TonB-dependent receptor [Acidobacteriota bacterium]